MKRILLIPSLLSFHFAYSGTGSANDEVQFILVLIAILLLIAAVPYSVHIIRRMVRDHKQRKMIHLEDHVNGDNPDSSISTEKT